MLGVVVIGRNEGERLGRCLNSLDLSRMQVVYVDSGSADQSVEYAKSFGALVVELDLSSPFTAARARNAGYVKLKQVMPLVEFVQFVDGDCSVSRNWFSTASQFLAEHSETAAVCGRRREINPNQSVYNWLCDMEWATPIGEATACGGDVLMRAEPFEDCNGFRESLIAGEEPELCIRMREAGWKIWRIDEEMTLHDAAITKFSQWWTRCKRGGFGMIEVATLHIRSPYNIWVRECLRVFIYGVFVPVLIIMGIFFPVLFCAAIAYPLLVIRIASRGALDNRKSWNYALLMTISKFAELSGMVCFIRSRFSLRKSYSIIEYK